MHIAFLAVIAGGLAGAVTTLAIEVLKSKLQKG